MSPGPVWTGAENLASTGIRSPDRTVRSDSLYYLRYPGLLCECSRSLDCPTVTLKWNSSTGHVVTKSLQ